MGGQGSGRLNKTDTFLKNNSNQSTTTKGHLASIGNEVLIIPNHSGDHSAGRVNTDPTTDQQIANKKYVDDLSVPRCSVWNSTDKTVSNGVITTMDFDSEDFDSDDMHDTTTNNSRITINEAGIYCMVGHVTWAHNTTGIRWMGFYEGGNALIGSTQVPATGSNAILSPKNDLVKLFKFSVGDYIELKVYQNSGGNLNASKNLVGSSLSVYKIGSTP